MHIACSAVAHAHAKKTPVVNSTFSGLDSNNLVPRSLGFVNKRFGYEIVIVR